jgi:1-deoxy-D-xylulose-5-phosphate reductoisomerase
MMARKKVVLLGASGSIGTNTLKVIRGNAASLELIGIAGYKRYRELAEIAHDFGVRYVGIFDEGACVEARKSGLFGTGVELLMGLDGLYELVSLVEADIVVVAMQGCVGLKPVLKALAEGKDIALASKEVLALGGKFVMEAAKKHNRRIIPIDSEHNAIFQCLNGARGDEVAKIILTASGGAFRDYSKEQMKGISPEDALKHPNWSMGKKVTIDSSSMANKGLELFEAKWLFDVCAEQLEVVIHPQSIVHSMVEFVDGSVLAQLCPPSMTFAIQHALLFPDRSKGVHESLDFSQVLQLDFYPPDTERFSCLNLAYSCIRAGGVAPAVFNAANEVGVDAFLQGKISFLDIAKLIEKTLEMVSNFEPDNLESILKTDAVARQEAENLIEYL